MTDIKTCFARYLASFNNESEADILECINEITVLEKTEDYTIYEIITDGNAFDLLIYDDDDTLFFHRIKGGDWYHQKTLAIMLNELPHVLIL